MDQNYPVNSDDPMDRRKFSKRQRRNYQRMMTLCSESTGEKVSNGVTFTLCMSVFGAICGTGLVYGYNLAVINNPSLVMKKYFSEAKKNRTGVHFSTRELNWYWACSVAALSLLAPVGCYLGTKSAKKFGRKDTLLANNLLLVVSALMQSFSKPMQSYEMFFLGRVLIGLQNGIGSAVGPMYVSEISPKKYRGSFGALFQWCLSLGIVLASVFGFEWLLGSEQNWPHLFTLLLVFGFIQVVILSFCPESPQYLLINKKKTNLAVESLRKLRGENYSIEEDVAEILKENEEAKKYPRVSYWDFFRLRSLRRPLFLAFVAAWALEFSGVVAIFMYSEPIFAAILSSSGTADPNMAKHMVALLSVARFITTSFSVPLVDKLGRRTCELIGTAGLIICNTVLAFLLSDLQTSGQSCFGFPLSIGGKYAVLAFLFLHTICFSVGVNTIAWLITPELFRTHARPKALFIFTTAFWAANFLVSLGFDLIQIVICGWVFLIFSILQLLFFVYFWFNFPVIDGKSVNEIAEIFESDSDSCIYKHHNYKLKKLRSSEEEERNRDERSALLELSSSAIE